MALHPPLPRQRPPLLRQQSLPNLPLARTREHATLPPASNMRSLDDLSLDYPRRHIDTASLGSNSHERGRPSSALPSDLLLFAQPEPDLHATNGLESVLSHLLPHEGPQTSADVPSAHDMSDRMSGFARLAGETTPTWAEALAAILAQLALIPSAGTALRDGLTTLSGGALLGSGVPGISNFIRQMMKNGRRDPKGTFKKHVSDAFSLANVGAAINTMATPFTQHRYATAISATLTAMGTAPTLYKALTTQHATVRMLSGASTVAYLTSSALAFNADKQSNQSEQDALNFWSTTAWMAGLAASAVANHIEAQARRNEQRSEGATLPLLNPLAHA